MKCACPTRFFVISKCFDSSNKASLHLYCFLATLNRHSFILEKHMASYESGLLGCSSIHSSTVIGIMIRSCYLCKTIRRYGIAAGHFLYIEPRWLNKAFVLLNKTSKKIYRARLPDNLSLQCHSTVFPMMYVTISTRRK